MDGQFARVAFGVRLLLPAVFIDAVLRIKQAAARVNAKHGLDPQIVEGIEDAAQAIVSGALDDQFPLVIWQTGSGTQTNMNVNEVIAGYANEKLAGTRGGKSPVHPNDHVNMSQSSNDSFPTALHVATVLATRDRLIPALEKLTAALTGKAKAWGHIVKIGRTHTQDATPLTLGQEFSGYAQQIANARDRIAGTLDRNIMPLAQGGTAVGTGLNAPGGVAEEVAAEIAGDHKAAREVHLVLPKTGVCSVDLGVSLTEGAGSGQCCGGPAPANVDACCVADAAAKAAQQTGCGCNGAARADNTLVQVR